MGDFMRDKLCFLVAKNPKKGITYAWISSMALVFAAFICACYSASKMQGGGAGNNAAGFAAVWVALLLIGVTVMGTLIMRKLQSRLAIGFFLGVILVMNSQMLILFAIFVDHAKKETDPKIIASQNAVAVFSFFLFVIYGIFGTILAVFRNDIIKDENFNEIEDNQGVPPENI